MKVNLPSWIKGKKREIDVGKSSIKGSRSTGPLDEGLYHFHKNRKIQTFSDARTITRVLKDSESGQKPDLALAFEEALLSIFQKYPNLENLTGVEKLLAEEKITAGIKYFIEILIIRNYQITDSLREQINYYLNFYNIPFSKKLQIKNIIDMFSQNSKDLDLFHNYIQGDPRNILFQLLGEDLVKYPSLRITKGPIGYEFRGSYEDINKLRKHSKGVGGFATFVPLKIGNKSVVIYLNFFIEGNQNTYSHELQHNINAMFLNFLNEGLIYDPLLVLKRIGKNPKFEKEILDKSYEANHKNLLSRFGDELLAQLRGQSSIERIKTNMLPVNSGSQYYNYTENFDTNNLSSVRGIKEYYYYSQKEDKIYPSISIVSEDDLKRAGLVLININEDLNLNAREEFKRNFNHEITRIIRALEIVLKNKDIDLKNVIGILSLSPVRKWEKLLKDLAIPIKRNRLLEALKKYLPRT